MIDKIRAHKFDVLVVISIAGILLTSVLVGVNIWLVTERATTQSTLRSTRAELHAARVVIAEEQKTRAREASLKKTAAKLACQQSIAGTKVANGIVSKIKKLAVDVADVSVNPAAKRVLIEDAAAFPMFPLPNCETGKTS